MLDAWAHALVSVLLVSLVSQVGVVFLSLNFKLGKSQLLLLKPLESMPGLYPVLSEALTLHTRLIRKPAKRINAPLM